MVWYPHLFKNFPKFAVIHTAKGFGIVNKAKVYVLELSWFFDDTTDVGNLISASSAFSKYSFYSWKFSVHILLYPSSKNFEYKFASMWKWVQLYISLNILWHWFLWDWYENWLFQSSGHCWVFKMCWHIECSTLTAPSFRIWYSLVGIPSPPLALLVVMLHKAHFTSHSRMSGSRWVISPSWLSGSWRSFLYSSSV